MQFARYVVVGISSNLVGYLLYLTLTGFGVVPKLAMSLLYGFGATLSFLGNRRWTFHNDGSITIGALRFALVYVIGYFLNLALLVIFVDLLGFPHQAVQATAVPVIAIMLFILLRLFVFPARRSRETL
jgi:putative flippase GtrA